MTDLRMLELRIQRLEAESTARANNRRAVPRSPDNAADWAVPNDYVSGHLMGKQVDGPAQRPVRSDYYRDVIAEGKAEAGTCEEVSGGGVAEAGVEGPVRFTLKPDHYGLTVQEPDTQSIRSRVEVPPGEAEHAEIRRYFRDDLARLATGVRVCLCDLRFLRDTMPGGTFRPRLTRIINNISALLEDDGAARGGDGDPLPEAAAVDPALVIGRLRGEATGRGSMLVDGSGRARFRIERWGTAFWSDLIFVPVALPPENSSAPGDDAEKAC